MNDIDPNILWDGVTSYTEFQGRINSKLQVRFRNDLWTKLRTVLAVNLWQSLQGSLLDSKYE